MKTRFNQQCPDHQWTNWERKMTGNINIIYIFIIDPLLKMVESIACNKSATLMGIQCWQLNDGEIQRTICNQSPHLEGEWFIFLDEKSIDAWMIGQLISRGVEVGWHTVWQNGCISAEQGTKHLNRNSLDPKRAVIWDF